MSPAALRLVRGLLELRIQLRNADLYALWTAGNIQMKNQIRRGTGPFFLTVIAVFFGGAMLSLAEDTETRDHDASGPGLFIVCSVPNGWLRKPDLILGTR